MVHTTTVRAVKRKRKAPEAEFRVLIVDSSPALSQLLQTRLELQDGVHCYIANSISSAEQLLQQYNNDFLVTIAGLNLIDGPDGEVVQMLREHEQTVIVLSGSLDKHAREKMFAQGIGDYVVKDGLTSIDYIARHVNRIAQNNGKQILIVDDSESFRVFLSSLLVKHGYQALIACDGEEAMELLEENATSISMVVTDYNMPRMNGLDMIQKIRETIPDDELPIIGVSDTDKPGVLARFLKGGASDYLKKPFCVEEFYCRIDRTLDMQFALNTARELANCDVLTKAYNRRFFFQRGPRYLLESLDKGNHIVAAMVDADKFKQINDNYGHYMGDEALIKITGALRENAKKNALVARFGGEEFVVLFDVEADDDPLFYLEILRESISKLVLEHEGERIPISASIGACSCSAAQLESYRQPGEEVPGDPGEVELTNMLKIADIMLYEAKEAGRNKVILEQGVSKLEEIG